MHPLLGHPIRPLLFLAILFSLALICVECGRYERSNPYDPEYTGNPHNAFLQVSRADLLEGEESGEHYRYFSMPVTVLNTGSSAAMNVKATISEGDNVASISGDTTLELGDILPSQSVSTEWPHYFRFEVLTRYKPPVHLRFFILFTAAGGVSWKDTIDTTIEPAKLTLLGVIIEPSGSGMNTRGFKMTPSIVNVGLGSAIAAEIELSYSDQRVTQHFPTALTLRNIPPGDTVVGAAPGEWSYFVFFVPDTTQLPFNTQFFFKMEVEDGTSWLDTADVVVTQ